VLLINLRIVINEATKMAMYVFFIRISSKSHSKQELRDRPAGRSLQAAKSSSERLHGFCLRSVFL
ncbi:hypothetical protein, partial [Sutterella wadsworthensis]|uniref:hypothetical protein n=1 Tax=Sutterella wadsworthensis TaxID=40545 RepID=UPI00242AA31E